MPMTDEMILQLAGKPATREQAFRGLMDAYQQRLYAVIRRQVPGHSDADDVLQNTLLKVCRHLHRFEGRSGLYTWMYRIAVNEVANHHQQQKRRSWVSLEDQLPERTADVYVNVDGLPTALEQAVSALPAQQQRVFRMRYYDELSYREIADLLELTEGSLKASFHHAVKKIEAVLKSQSWI